MSDDFAPKSEFLATLIARGFVHQCSDFAGLDEKARKGGLSAYIGFDCTAPSLHVGSLLPIMMLAWLQRTGGKPLTADRRRHDAGRRPFRQGRKPQAADVEQIDANKASIKTSFREIPDLRRRRRTDALMLDNAEWLAG